jgi:hypothetical protein
MIGRLVALLAVLCLGACTAAPTGTPFLHPQLVVNNGTTLTVELAINGQQAGRYEPGQSISVGLSALPPLPWEVTAQTAAGRPLGTFSVPAGDPYMTTQPEGESGGGAHYLRTVLTCGTLLVWAGTVPPGGLNPTPEPGGCGP